MLEDRDGGHWEGPDPDTTISVCVTTATSSSEGPPCHNEIEWANITGGKTTQALAFNLTNELDKAKQSVICTMKTRFYCLNKKQASLPCIAQAF